MTNPVQLDLTLLALLVNPYLFGRIIREECLGLPPYNEWLTDIYELIVKDYVEDVYVDIIETYVIATIKVIL